MSLLFPHCGKQPLGIYPIVDSAQWVQYLVARQTHTVQLRIKSTCLDEIEQHIIASIRYAREYQARLFINDYWQLAIKHQAYGVHLGQEDLHTADLAAIAHAGMRLGVSTHCEADIANACAVRPSYLAYGPIYPTQSKVMSFTPRGLVRLSYWCDCLDYPVVAIGGINLGNIAQVIAAGVDGVAFISAITHAQDPAQTLHELLATRSQFLRSSDVIFHRSTTFPTPD